MPQDIPYTWSEDEHMLFFVLQVSGAKQKNIDVALCDVYVKVNCRPALFEADLRYEVDPEHKKTFCRIGSGKVTLSLKKKEPRLWHDFHAVGTRTELIERRNRALADNVEREQARSKRKHDLKYEMIKAAEHEQWRLDRESREQIEKWEAEEKAKWEEDVLGAFDRDTGELKEQPSLQVAAQHAPAEAVEVVQPSSPIVSELQVADQGADQVDVEVSQSTDGKEATIADVSDTQAIWSEKDLADNEEYEEPLPAVRANPGKMGVRFTERPRPGVPVRDRGQRAPPLPKGTVKSELPPMLAGDTAEDEADPVWLKDKADSLMTSGDYQGAYNAYTEALKIALNARAFANRAVADLYLGHLPQCIEDCSRALGVLDKRRGAAAGHLPGPVDPEDQHVRACVEVRLGIAHLWLGAFNKAEEHLQRALDVEDGLEAEERLSAQEDLSRVRRAHAALATKSSADAAVQRAHGSDDLIAKELEAAADGYDKAIGLDTESAVLYANRSLVRLRMGKLPESEQDAETALHYLKQWPVSRKAPKGPARPARLEPPYLDDPTFKHPDEVKQGEVDWLMKHNGGTSQDLPPLPPEYEWIKDVAEKSDNAWIAVRKKMSKAAIDAIRDATRQLQDALYTRCPRTIRDQVTHASDLNRTGEGPSSKAIIQAEEYAKKLEDHAKERVAEQLQEQEELQRDLNECQLEEELAFSRPGVVRVGFCRGHPVEGAQRRLFAKVTLRRARVYQLLGQTDAAVQGLRSVLSVEPHNHEARELLASLTPAP